MRIILTFILIFFFFSIKAHCPIDLLQIIGKSKLIVTGEVITSNSYDFQFKVDSVIKGILNKDVINILYKKDKQKIIKTKDSSYYTNFNNYIHKQKLMLFLEIASIENGDTIWGSVGNYDEAEMKIYNDSIIIGSTVYYKKEKCSVLNFIDAVTNFENCFKMEYIDILNKVVIKQIVTNKRLEEYNKSKCHNKILETLKNHDRLHKWKKNKKWVKDFGGYMPYNGKYELVNPNNNLIEYKGKYKKGIHIKEVYIENN